MTETEFLQLSESTLRGIESAIEKALALSDADIECMLSGNILEIEFMESGAKVIVNSQLPMKEIWVAAPRGAYHFRHENGQWLDSRTGGELHAALSDMISAEAGERLMLVV